MWSIFRRKSDGRLVAVNDDAYPFFCSDAWEGVNGQYYTEQDALNAIKGMDPSVTKFIQYAWEV